MGQAAASGSIELGHAFGRGVSENYGRNDLSYNCIGAGFSFTWSGDEESEGEGGGGEGHGGWGMGCVVQDG